MSIGWYEPVDLPPVDVFTVGLDLARSSDYTGICVLQRVGEPAITEVRHLERFRGQAYTEIVRHVRNLIAALRAARPQPRVTLALDATGVGTVVLDVLNEADIDAPIVPVLITAGERPSREGGVHRVPKKDLVDVIAVAMEGHRLKIAPDLAMAPILTEELSKFRLKRTKTGRDAYEAWRESDHDDLVLSVSIGMWAAERGAGGEFQQLPADTLAWLEEAFG